MPSNDPQIIINTMLKRGHLLRHIIDGTRDRRILARSLDESRTTVYRGLDQLEECKLVTEVNGHYSATEVGHFVSKIMMDTKETTQTLVEAEEILGDSLTTEYFSPSVLQNTDVIFSDPHDPGYLIEDFVREISDSEMVRGLLQAAVPQLTDTLFTQTVEQSIQVELVVRVEMIDTYKRRYPDEYEDALASGRFHLLQAESLPSFSLFITLASEPSVSILGHGPYGNIRGYLNGTGVDLFDWANRIILNYQETASTLGLTRSSSMSLDD